MAAERNLSVITHQCREALAFGRRVELVLVSGASVKGMPTRIVEDLARKSDALRGAGRSHLLVELDGGVDVVEVERVREVRPTL